MLLRIFPSRHLIFTLPDTAGEDGDGKLLQVDLVQDAGGDPDPRETQDSGGVSTGEPPGKKAKAGSVWFDPDPEPDLHPASLSSSFTERRRRRRKRDRRPGRPKSALWAHKRADLDVCPCGFRKNRWQRRIVLV